MYMYKFPLPICSFIINTTIVWFGGEGTENLWRARFLHDKHFAPDRVEVDPNNITLHPGKNHVRGLVTEHPICTPSKHQGYNTSTSTLYVSMGLQVSLLANLTSTVHTYMYMYTV